jgi:hypothetical protein
MGFAINTRGCGSGTDMQSSPPGHRALVRLNNHSRDPFHRHRHRLHSDVTVAVPRSPRSMPLGWRLGSENENRGYCGSQGSHGVKATRGLSPSRMPEKCLSTTYLSIFTPTPPTPLLLAWKPRFCWPSALGAATQRAPMSPTWRFAGGIGSHVRGRGGGVTSVNVV